MATFSFNYDTKIVTVELPDTQITIQELVNAVATEQATLLALNNRHIAYWEGKLEVSTGLSSGISFKFFHGWRLAFAARGGPSWVQCEVLGGNLISYIGSDETTAQQIPIAPTAFVATGYAKSTEAALLNATDVTTIKNDVELLRYGGVVYINTAAGTAGTAYDVGTRENPSNNLTDALAIANANGIREFGVRGTLTLTGTLDDWVVRGIGEEAEININGQDVADSEFLDIKLTGTIGNGPIRASRCDLNGLDGVSGTFDFCALLVGTISCTGDSSFYRCVSGVPGTGYPRIDMNSLAIGVELRDYSGSFGLENLANVGASFSADMLSGRAIMESSTTAMQSGRIGGTCEFVNNGTITSWNLGGHVSFDSIWRLKDIPPSGILQ